MIAQTGPERIIDSHGIVLSCAGNQAVRQRSNEEANVHVFATAQFKLQLECEQMPNLMVALPNIGGALCSTPQSLADAHYWSAVQ